MRKPQAVGSSKAVKTKQHPRKPDWRKNFVSVLTNEEKVALLRHLLAEQDAMKATTVTISKEYARSIAAATKPDFAQRQSEKITLAEAFDYSNIANGEDDPSTSARNNERAIRSVSFLLHWMSQHGNEFVEGMAAHGLATVLYEVAQRL